MVIDVHTHYYPSEYLSRIGRLEQPPLVATALSQQDLTERLTLLGRLGVDTQVLSVSQAQPYLPAARDAAEAARLANDLYVDRCARHPGRSFASAALALPHLDESLAKPAWTGDEPSVVGVTLGCSIGGLQLDDLVLDPVCRELDRRHSVGYLDPVGQESTPWLSGHNRAWLVGAPFEDTAALRLILGGVLDRYPAILFMVPHLGGTIPFFLARVTRKGDDRIAPELRFPYCDTVSRSPEALACSCQAFDPERLLLRTDHPCRDQGQFAHHLRDLDQAPLGDEELEAIRGATARSLLTPDSRLEGQR